MYTQLLSLALMGRASAQREQRKRRRRVPGGDVSMLEGLLCCQLRDNIDIDIVGRLAMRCDAMLARAHTQRETHQ